MRDNPYISVNSKLKTTKNHPADRVAVSSAFQGRVGSGDRAEWIDLAGPLQRELAQLDGQMVFSAPCKSSPALR